MCACKRGRKGEIGGTTLPHHLIHPPSNTWEYVRSMLGSQCVSIPSRVRHVIHITTHWHAAGSSSGGSSMEVNWCDHCSSTAFSFDLVEHSERNW